MVEDGNGESEYDKVTWKDKLEMFRSGELNAFSVMYSYMLRSFDVKPGGEFKAAYEAGLALNAYIVLGDRPVSITIKRLWMGLTFTQKWKLLYDVLFSNEGIEIPDQKTEADSENGNKGDEIESVINEVVADRNLLTAELQRMGRKWPWLVECLINERDKFMVLELEQVKYSVVCFCCCY